MASFDEHINKCKHNLLFLSEINLKSSSFWDWQVTTCYYIAVHLVNAHIARVADLHYRTHEDTKNALNPCSELSLCKIPEELFTSYVKLENLSRRSRYMCSDTFSATNNIANRTKPEHFARAIRHLDKLIEHFKTVYSIEFDKCKIVCPEISKGETFHNFIV